MCGSFCSRRSAPMTLVLKSSGSGDAGAPDAVVFDVLPDPLVGVELRGVGGSTNSRSRRGWRRRTL